MRGFCVCVCMYACVRVRACARAPCMHVSVYVPAHTCETWGGGGGHNVIKRDGKTLLLTRQLQTNGQGRGIKERKGRQGSSFSLVIICFSDHSFSWEQ